MLLSLAVFGECQALYTWGVLPGSTSVQVERVDLSTGALTPIATTDSPGAVAGAGAIDLVGHRLFFQSSAGGSYLFYAVNLTNGSYSKIPGNLGQVQYDSGAGVLYDLIINALEPEVQVFSVDQTTGALRLVSFTTSSATGYIVEASIDSVGHRLFFLGLDGPTGNQPYIFVVNLTDGSFSKVPISTPTNAIQYDSGSGTLYAGGFFNGSSTAQIASVNLSSGALTVVATTDATSWQNTNSAFDSVNHRLFFAGSQAGGASSLLYTVNLTNGTFSKLSGTFGGLVFDPNTASSSVPDASAVSLVLCGVGLAGVATGLIRFRVA